MDERVERVKMTGRGRDVKARGQVADMMSGLASGVRHRPMEPTRPLHMEEEHRVVDSIL